MKAYCAFLAFLALSLSAAAQAPQKIDASKSFVRFVSKQMNVPVEGRFRKLDGTVAYDPSHPESAKAEVEVDLASIDLGSEEAEQEVRRPLWFNVERFPKARFVLASLKPAGAGKYDASGSLSIKGVTQEVSVPVTLTEAGGTRSVEGQFTVKRLGFRVGEGHWSDVETVADDVLIRFRLATPATR